MFRKTAEMKTIPAALLAFLASMGIAGAGLLPANFDYTQTDLTSGSGTLSASVNVGSYGGPDTFLDFTGTMPPAVVSSTYAPPPVIPSYAIGALDTVSSTGLHAVHIGWSGSATLTAVDPVSSDVWTIDVPLVQADDGNYQFEADVRDDPSLGFDLDSDTENSDPRGTRFAFWLGEYQNGFRENNLRNVFQAGETADVFANDDDVCEPAKNEFCDTSESGSAAGADLGLSFGIRQEIFTGAALLDRLEYAGPIGADDATVTRNGVAAPKLPVLPADPFTATFDIGPRMQRVASGHIGFPDPNDALTPVAGTETSLLGIPLNAGGALFTASISFLDQNGNFEGRIHWRDRGDSAAGAQNLVQLGEDFIYNRDDGIMRLTLDDLPPGDYDVTSYHIDPAPDTSAGDEPGESVRVLVDNGDGTGFNERGLLTDRTLDLGGVDNLTTQEIENTALNFGFTADGLNPVVIIFNSIPDPVLFPGGCGGLGGVAAGDEAPCEVPLNGLVFDYTPGFPGDINGDELVNELDLNVIRMNFFETEVGGMPVELSDGDLNGDSVVDFLDYRLWKFFVPAALAHLSLSVPEPSTLLISVLGSTAFIGIRRRD